MLFLVRLKRQLCKNFKNLIHPRACYSRVIEVKNDYIYPNPEDDYSKVPQYPPIERVDEEYLKSQEVKAWHDKIKRQKTVEEKLFEINIPRYWGWKCLFLKEGEIPYNSLEFTKFITRTHVKHNDDLPDIFKSSSQKCFYLAEDLSPRVENLIEDNYFKLRQNYTTENSDELSEEKKFTATIVNSLNRLILKTLKDESKVIPSIQIDYSPRMEAYWNLGSLTETYKPEKYKYGMKEDIPEEYLGRPSDKYIQYIGKPLIQLRSENPLPPLMEHSEALYLEYPVPIYNYDPFVVFGSEMVRRHVTNIPGFWPGDSREFSFLSYHDTNHLKFRPETYGSEEMSEALQCQAILASFAWLTALASYQGFTTFHDVTYPFVSQTVLTDGQDFSFAVFQLNTIELYHENPLYNPKCNICWITPKMRLYEIEDGEIKGVNKQVIKFLLQIYLTQTEMVEKCVRKPYLGDDIKTVSDYEHEEKRCWLEKSFKHFSSNRPRHRIDKMYEPTDYERIFKIQFAKIIRDARRRPFELRQNPYLRKMSDHTPEYIPRSLRPDKDLPKYKQKKFKNTYYPERSLYPSFFWTAISPELKKIYACSRSLIGTVEKLVPGNYINKPCKEILFSFSSLFANLNVCTEGCDEWIMDMDFTVNV